MPLLNEGTKVVRPVVACIVENNIYEILGTEQGLTPEDLDEEWLYPVGSFVYCKTEQDVDNIILVADRLCTLQK